MEKILFGLKKKTIGFVLQIEFAWDFNQNKLKFHPFPLYMYLVKTISFEVECRLLNLI